MISNSFRLFQLLLMFRISMPSTRRIKNDNLLKKNDKKKRFRVVLFGFQLFEIFCSGIFFGCSVSSSLMFAFVFFCASRDVEKRVSHPIIVKNVLNARLRKRSTTRRGSRSIST